MYIGVDVGGTKTHIRVEDLGEHRDLIIPTREWMDSNFLGESHDVHRLANYIRDVGGRDDAPLGVGAHGCDSPEIGRALEIALVSERGGSVRVVNDARLIGPAAGSTSSICVVIGTGSIVVGSTVDGVDVMIGGHGWMLADPGSAPALVRESVKAVLRRDDDGHPPDALGERLLAEFDAHDPHDLAANFTDNASMQRWASAAPLVFLAAVDGSADATGVIASAARDLARQVGLALGRGAVAEEIIAAGGVVVNQPLLASELARELTAQGVVQPFRVLREPPVAGAVAIARLLDPVPVGSTKPSSPDGPHNNRLEHQ
jgi:N-acetylglucosamine kinase-like BadF-type ATPase